jgi:ribosomal protein S21
MAVGGKQTCAQIRARRTRNGANDVVSARAGIAAEIETASFGGENKKAHGWPDAGRDKASKGLAWNGPFLGHVVLVLFVAARY